MSIFLRSHVHTCKVYFNPFSTQSRDYIFYITQLYYQNCRFLLVGLTAKLF